MLNKWRTKLTSSLLILSVFLLYPTFCAKAQTFWVFNHGVSDHPSSFSYLRSNLGLSTTQFQAPNFQVGSTTTTLMDQAAKLNSNISTNLYAQRANKIILVGHSQGGLRARRYLQRELTRDASKLVNTSKVRGLALIGTPNYGAHAAANYPNLLNQIEAITAITLTYTVVGVPLLGAIRELKTLYRDELKMMFGGPSLTQMKPGSPFLSELNNYSLSACTTRNTSSNMSFLWGTKQVASSSQSCGTGNFPGFKDIPSNTFVMNIVGQNSSLANAADTAGLAVNHYEAAAIATVLASFFYAASFFLPGIAIPVAVALTGFIVLMLALQAMWNGMIGSGKHDILVSEESQELRNARGIGGNFLLTRKLPQALHADIRGTRSSTARNDNFELRSLATRTALIGLRDTVNQSK